MAFATGARADLIFMAETVFGATPATVVAKPFRMTGNSLNLTKENLQSNEIRSDRQIADVRHGNKQIGGSLDFELSYSSFDDFLAAALFGSWGTDVLTAATVAQYFSIEKRFLDVDRFHRFTGCMVNSFSLNIQPNAIVTGSFDILGKGFTTHATSMDASPATATTYSPMDSFTGVLKENSATIAVVASLDFQLQNNLNPTFVIGAATTPQIVSGRSNLTGNMSVYFENDTLMNKFVDETESSLELTLTDGTRSYTILIPRLKYMTGDIPVQDENALQVSMQWQALRDETEETNIKITRASS